MRSANFDHLRSISEQLFRLGFLAERFFAEDPNTSLIKSRQFAETLLKEIAARTGTYRPELREQFSDMLQRLQAERVVPREVSDVFHAIRKRGNVAVHDLAGGYNEALSCLKFARSLGVWFHQTFARDPNFKPSPFVPPPDPQGESRELAAELEMLRQRVREAEAKAAAASATAEKQARARAAAEEMAQREREDQRQWEEVAREQEAAQARLGEELARLQAAAAAASDQETVSLIQAGRDAATKLKLDEADTRRLIDVQLNEMGWEANSQELRYAKGARPEQGRNQAIAEWPTETGPVDYALFVGLTCVGVVEAKKQSIDVPSILEQAKRYARSVTLARENLSLDAPWQHGLDEPYRVPFIFATNGRPFVRQWITKSGIWYWDARSERNHPAALTGRFSPDDLKAKLDQDPSLANAGLAEEAFGYGGVRPYQEEAIRAVEQAVEQGQREILISMATGTGKTRTCIALMYRLLKHKRFCLLLFLVDRTALGDQTTDALETTELEGLLKFSQIYKVAGLDQRLPEPEDHVQVATVQAMVGRILREPDPSKRPTPGTYDCIIVDEAHRGYTLDAELRESDIGFRNVEDYQSAYRQVLDYFDAVKIGLTATPALHTREIFGHPVYRYGYRQAVVEGWLIDHLPPKRITTALAEAGIHFDGGEEVEIVDPRTGQIDLFELPDDVSLDYDLAAFNKRVYSENFNRVVCEAIAQEIPPDRPGKTLIFAARDSHADDVVRLLTKALEEEYGAIPAGMVQKITGSVPGNKDLILKFRNDPYPQYVVTVDLLTTGVDIPSISNLVFMDRSQRFLTLETAKRLGCTFLERGDVLIARMPDPIGRACVFPGVHQPAVTAVDVLVWRGGKFAADPNWLTQAVNSPVVRAQIQAEAGGTTRQRASGGRLKALKLIVPPRIEQERLVSKVKSLTAKSARARVELASVDKLIARFRETILTQAFTGKMLSSSARSDVAQALCGMNGPTSSNYEIPAQWRLYKVGEIGEIKLGKMLDKAKNKGEPTPYLRNINVRWGSFDTSDILMMRFTPDERKDFAIQDGDVLVCEGGEPGRAAVWEGGKTQLCYQKALHRVRLKQGYSPKLFSYFLKWFAETGQLFSFLTGTTIKHLPRNAFARLPVWFPDGDGQIDIVRRIEAASAKIDRLAAEAKRALELTDRLDEKILAKAFRGELVPQDPNDEPARVLLERIRAERAAQPKAKRGRRAATT